MDRIIILYLARKKLFSYFLFIKSSNLPLYEKINYFYKFYKDLKNKYRKRIIFKLNVTTNLNIVNSLENLNIQKKLIYKQSIRENTMSSPILFNSTLSFPSLKGFSPDINIYTLKNCTVYANSTAVSDKNNIYDQYLYSINLNHDLKNKYMEDIISYDNKIITMHTKIEKKISQDDIYIHFLNYYPTNYYHWMYEAIPKLILINSTIMRSEDLKNKNYILLIDEKLHKNLLYIMKSCIDFNYQIKILQSYEKVFIENMIYCNNLWVSLDNTTFQANYKKDFFVDKYAVKLIYDKFKLSKGKVPFRKIYLDRNKKQARSLLNNDELKNMLINYNFEIPDIDNLSFNEQRILFNEAKIIIGVSGAAFSNIIFMQSNSNAIILSPNTTGANYYVFQQIADVSAVNLTHILTNKNISNHIHESSSISINDVKILLDKLI